MSDRLFDIEEFPEVPIFREPRSRKGPAAGSRVDARFQNDYPPEWSRCPECEGHGKVWGELVAEPAEIASGETVQAVWTFEGHELTAQRGPLQETLDDVGEYLGFRRRDKACPACKGMGSVKGRVRLEAGFRCLRCGHPYVPKGDAAMLGVEPSWKDGCEGWTACDDRCDHTGPLRVIYKDGVVADASHYERIGGSTDGEQVPTTSYQVQDWYSMGEDYELFDRVEAAWRILTVHHADGDKANLAWWNLLALCQVCHLAIQAKVVMERVYPHEHSEWFRPFVAGYYAKVYLCAVCGRPESDGHHRGRGKVGDGVLPHPFRAGLELTREETEARLEELLALERIA